MQRSNFCRILPIDSIFSLCNGSITEKLCLLELFAVIESSSTLLHLPGTAFSQDPSASVVIHHTSYILITSETYFSLSIPNVFLPVILFYLTIPGNHFSCRALTHLSGGRSKADFFMILCQSSSCVPQSWVTLFDCCVSKISVVALLFNYQIFPARWSGKIT